MPASAAEATAPPTAESFSYPGAAQILAQQHVTLKSGDGNIQLADCASTENLVEVFSRTLDLGPVKVCFRVTGLGGYLALELPKVYNIKGDDHAVKATLNTGGSVSSMELRNNFYAPVGEGTSSEGTTLLELTATGGPAVPADTTDTPALGRVVIGQPGHIGGRACTATLVDRYWALTSASCFTDTPASLGAGAPATKGAVSIGGKTVDIAELVPRTDRDLVMARLAAPVDDITPAKLATTPPVAGEDLRVPGFGRTATQWRPSASHTVTHTVGAVTATGVDTTPAAGSSAICQGDTGAPLLRNANGITQIAAIAARSWQGGCLGTLATETRTGASSTRTDDLSAWVADLRFRSADVQAGTHVQVIGANDTLWDTVVGPRPGGSWSPVTSGTLAAVDTVAIGDTLHIFVVGSDGHVYTRDGKVGGTWTPWGEVPGGAAGVSGITATARGTMVSLQIIGSDGSLYSTGVDYAAGYWRPSWDRVDTNNLKAVTSATTANGAVHVFAVNEDRRVYTRDNNLDGSWTAWGEVPGNAVGVEDITASARGNIVDLQIIGSEGSLYTTNGNFDAGHWDPAWSKVSDNKLRAITSSAENNVVHVIAINEDYKVYQRDADYNAGRWTEWSEVPGGAVGVKALTAATTG
ncbi:trypsin-like serine protease [Kitasatospora sp. NPDC086009]|uniref:trypsin-like serine protease n=1 Tax=unclassified Kitasatospora TaxID=2633591 RepID=UPI0037C53AF1